MVGHSGEEYEAVRQRVQVLRKQHRDIVEARRAAEHAESLASLKFAEEREAIESACRHQVDEIQRKLRDAVERSARAREHHDKEKRVLVAKLNALSGKLEEKHGAEMAERDAEIARLESAVMRAREETRVIQDMHAKDRMDWQMEEEECKREIERLILEDQTKSREESGQWKERARKAETMLSDAAQKLKRALQDLELKADRVCDLEQTVAFLNDEREQEATVHEAACEEYEARLERAAGEGADALKRAREDAGAQLAAYREKKRADLDTLHEKFKTVIAHKDGAIAGLRDQIRGMSETIQSLQYL